MASLLFRANQRLLVSQQNTINALFKQNSTAKSSTTNRDLPAKANEKVDVVKQDESDKDLIELKTDRALLYPDTMEWLDERQVRISKPSKNVMQSGTANLNTWKIEFDSKERWENWLMGWTSSGDPVSNLILNFPTKESAIAFCDKNKLQWFVEEQPERKIRRKSYADNFAYNRRTRLGSK